MSLFTIVLSAFSNMNSITVEPLRTPLNLGYLANQDTQQVPTIHMHLYHSPDIKNEGGIFLNVTNTLGIKASCFVYHLYSSSLHFLSSLHRHWLQAGGLLLVVLASIATGVYVGAFSGLETKYRIAIICFIAVLNIVLFK